MWFVCSQSEWCFFFLMQGAHANAFNNHVYFHAWTSVIPFQLSFTLFISLNMITPFHFLLLHVRYAICMAHVNHFSSMLHLCLILSITLCPYLINATHSLCFLQFWCMMSLASTWSCFFPYSCAWWLLHGAQLVFICSNYLPKQHTKTTQSITKKIITH